MKKQCPFNLNIAQKSLNFYAYDENGNLVNHTHVLSENQEPTKCPGKACGCWRFGACRRKS